MTKFQDLRAMEHKQDYLGLIQELKKLVKKDKRVFTDHYIKEWCGRRWRNLFITAAAKDPHAVKVASKKLVGIKLRDTRPARQKIADRFMRLQDPTEWRIEMPGAQVAPIKKTSLIFAPGLLTGMLPVQAFREGFPALQQELGINILRADSHPMRGCEANVADLLRAIEQGIGHDAAGQIIAPENAKPPGDFFFISYSKGAPDVLTLLVKRPDLKTRTRCFINWAGAPGGSHLANNIYDALKGLPTQAVEERLTDLLRLVSPAIKLGPVMSRMHEFDIKESIKDLTMPTRSEFNKLHNAALDAMDIPIFNITGSTSALEVPYFQVQGVLELNRYDANNDMQVTQHCAKIHMPMATDLAMLHGHHWDLSYSPFPKTMRFGSPNLDHPFPKGAAAIAMTQFMAELGLVD